MKLEKENIEKWRILTCVNSRIVFKPHVKLTIKNLATFDHFCALCLTCKLIIYHTDLNAFQFTFVARGERKYAAEQSQFFLKHYVKSFIENVATPKDLQINYL